MVRPVPQDQAGHSRRRQGRGDPPKPEGRIPDVQPIAALRGAVEAAVARLRSGLGHKEIVATVVKRGYRLAIDEEH